MNKLQAPYLCQSNANYLAYHKYKNGMIIITFNVSKHKTRMAHFSRCMFVSTNFSALIRIKLKNKN